MLFLAQKWKITKRTHFGPRTPKHKNLDIGSKTEIIIQSSGC